ncbi:TonB-dependent receptor [Aquimarina aquimarini]|uniref:TonB-dependent receptor n=1 Tax=Aquimarina aquimarini TaxID=1191734 RepID=UPI000D54FF35|nr:TonB-dependent receptor [Aquimarina aquimarini]
MKITNFNLLNFLTLVVVFCCTSTVFGQDTGVIEGKVYTNDSKPASGVNIFIENTKLGGVSDTNGEYSIKNIPQGEQTIVFSVVGLSKKSVTVNITSGVTIMNDVFLQASSQALEEVVLNVKKENKFDRKETLYVARLPLKNIENPQVYSVITKDLLQELQVNDIQGAIQNAPGINNVMQGIGSGGVGLNFIMRGFSADIAMRNGVGTAFRTGTDPANLERIEVIKGPSGTLFGTNMVSSYGGVVNRVTKKAYANFGGSVEYSTGSNNLSRIAADLNTPLNEEKTVLFRVNASKHNEHSFQDYGLIRNLFIAPTLTYRPNERLELNVEAEFYKNDAPSTYFNVGRAGVSNADDLNYNFEYSYGSDYLSSTSESFNIFAEAKYKISENWTSQTVVSTSNVDNNANYLFLDFLNKSDAERRIMNLEAQFYTTQVQQNITGKFDIGFVKNKILIGADYYHLRTPFRRTQFVYDTIGYANPQADFNRKRYDLILGETEAFRVGQRDQSSVGAYVSNVAELTKKLSVMASLRVDHFNDKEGDFDQTTFSPKFGAVYQIVEDKLSVFGNYMDGFSNVSPDVLSDRTVRFNPEHAIQIEGGIKAELFDNKLSATFSYYNITVRDAVRWIRGDEWYRIQDGERGSKGFELEVIANPIKGWNIVAGYANNKSEYLEGDESIVGNTPFAAPENTLNFWTSYKLPKSVLKGLGFGFGANYTDESFLSDANTFTVPSYTVLNSALFYDHKDFRVGLKFNNITNEKYWANMGTYLQPQRENTVIASFMYKF